MLIKTTALILYKRIKMKNHNFTAKIRIAQLVHTVYIGDMVRDIHAQIKLYISALHQYDLVLEVMGLLPPW